MITELNEVDPDVTPGAQIDVVRYRIRNFRLHGMMENLSRLLISIVEIQSNDTSATVVPSDVRDILAQYDIIKGDLDFAIEVNDAPVGSYQHAFVTLFLHQKEVQRVRNIKVKSVVKDLWMLGMVILGCDSAKSQNFVSNPDSVKIKRALEVCAKSLERWIGTGEAADKLGLEAPAFETSGTLMPDVDADFAQKLEPSKTIPKPMLDDVPDIPTGGTGK
jgi:hypothetical protein